MPLDASPSGSAAAPLVEAQDVRIMYDAFCAIDGASFTVRRGEKFVIIGPSGCGKTTLLKAVAGFIRPAGGVILVNGAPVGEPGPDRAVVFQDFEQLFPWRTVLSNITYALAVAAGVRGEAGRDRARRMLDLVGIAHAAGRFPHQLSGDMKQRAAIARALALEPQILLMDEPFGALDEITRSRLGVELNEIWRRTGVTIILVTHSIPEAVFLGHRVMVMGDRAGRVREIVDTEAAEAWGDPAFEALTDHLRGVLIAPPPAASEAGAAAGRSPTASRVTP
ncbi:MAG TPA: ABC transporter ATP-binding protein [bacterium]|nr:ABC transporter ATP-binding protein [bacterium]